MSTILRSAVYVAAFTLPPLAVGALRGIAYLARYDGRRPVAGQLPPSTLPAAPAYDSSKPTVAYPDWRGRYRDNRRARALRDLFSRRPLQRVPRRSGYVTTRFGATLLPSLVATQDNAAIRRLDRLVVTEETHAPNVVSGAISRIAPALPVVQLDTDSGRYPLETVLEDLARSADMASAQFAEKRLEYRSARIRFEGRVVPWQTLALPFLIGGASALFARLAMRLGRSNRDLAKRTAAYG